MSIARNFNGTSDYLRNSTGYLSGSAGPFTMMWWMKSGSLAQTNAYLVQPSNASGTNHCAGIYGFVNDGSGHARVEFYSSAGTTLRAGSQITILDTNWHHICYLYLGAANQWSYFLDGVKTVINSSVTDTIPTGLVQFAVGAAYAASSSNWFNGALAEVALWSVNLSDVNITAIANPNGLTLPSSLPTNLLGYWPLGLASPDTDQSAANHPLTVNGTTLVAGPYGPSFGPPSSAVIPVLTVQQW